MSKVEPISDDDLNMARYNAQYGRHLGPMTALPLIARLDATAAERDQLRLDLQREAGERDAAVARAEKMEAALRDAAKQFDFYERQHAAKGTPDAAVKAEVNRQMAAKMRAALGSAP